MVIYKFNVSLSIVFSLTCQPIYNANEEVNDFEHPLAQITLTSKTSLHIFIQQGIVLKYPKYTGHILINRNIKHKYSAFLSALQKL